MARQLVTQKATLRTAAGGAALCRGTSSSQTRGRTKKLQGPKSRPCLIFKHALTYVVGS
ncbi:MAG: hypothetical protein JWO04_824 [Gammaproteobacteria bacterium]|nr:hypothetical protein [Gammaproteobacteria bacterium]